MTISVTLVSGQSAVVGIASSREAYEIEVSSGIPGPAGVSVDSANVVGGMLNLTLSNGAVVNAGSVMGSANTGTITFTGNTIGQLNNNSINIVTNGKEWTFGNDGTFSIPGAIYANGSLGSNGQVLTSTGTSVHWADATGTGGVSSAQLAANLANYQTRAGLAANVATLAANNTSFVGTVSAANVVSNAQLSSNLANYQTTTGLAANVAALTSNNTLFLGGIAANQYAYANAIPSVVGYQTTAGLAANVATLAANNASYLGGIAANQYAYANTVVDIGDITFTNTTISTATNNNITISTSQNDPSACPAINSTSSWTFGMDGMLTLPVGGDIRNSNGTSVLGIPGWSVDATNDLIPATDNLQDIGTPSARVRHIYVGPGSVTIGNSVISESTTGKLVLPGVTRATTLFADEVEDTSDQTHSFNSTPSVIIDAYEYAVRSGVETPPGSYVPAEYGVGRLDDDGYIDEIGIVEQGIWTQDIAVTNRRNPMYVYIGSNINESFNPSNWIDIPFVVRSKANDVEYEFDGGGADLGSFTFDGDMLEADQMTIKTNDGDIHITSDSDVFVQTANGDKEWRFDTAGNLKLPQGGDIVDSSGNSVLGSGSTDRLVNGSYEVVLDSSGHLTAPGNIKTGTDGGRFIQDCADGTTSMRWINLLYESDGELIRVYSNSGTSGGERAQLRLDWLDNNRSGLTIRAFDRTDSEDVVRHDWKFNGDGSITFPDSTVQSTAYTGQGGGSSTVARQDTAPSANNGTLWYNTIEGRTYIKYNDQWVDASPLVMPPPETELDVNSITFADATVLTSATALTPNKLVNGEYEAGLDQDGVLNLPRHGAIRNLTGSYDVNVVGAGPNGFAQLQWTTLAGAAEDNPNNTDELLHWVYIEEPGVFVETNVNGEGDSHEWKFGTDGSLKFPGTSDYRITESEPGLVVTSELGFAITTSSVQNAKDWIFSPSGDIKFPTLTVPISDNTNPSGTGQTLKFSDPTQQAIIYGPSSTPSNINAERVIIQGAPGYASTDGEGGDVYLWAGPGGSSNGQGGDIKVRAGRGNGTGGGGYLNFQAGDSGTGQGGYINIESGASDIPGQGGQITIEARSGGEVTVRTANTFGYTKTWKFNNTGGLVFPDNTVQTTAFTGGAAQENYQFNGVDVTKTVTVVNFSLLYCSPAQGYSGNTTHTVVLPAAAPGHRLAIINNSTQCQLNIDVGGYPEPWYVAPLGKAELIYASDPTGGGDWHIMYGATVTP